MFDFTEENVEAAPKIPYSIQNCTVVSLLPYPVKEPKPGIIPSYFQIPRCKDTNQPSVLQVGEAIHWYESPFKDQPPIKMTHNSREVAKAIVNDLIEAQLGLDSDAAPGLFWVEGHFETKDIVQKFKTNLEDAKNRQLRWFVTLVRIADDDWARYHQHKFVSDLQRYAAKSMGLDREWTTTAISEVMVQCPLCKEYVRGDAIVHSSCGFVLKKEEYMKMQKDGLILEVTK